MEVEKLLVAIPPGNLVHMDNILLQNCSNTKAAQVAELQPEPVGQPQQRGLVGLLPRQAVGL